MSYSGTAMMATRNTNAAIVGMFGRNDADRPEGVGMMKKPIHKRAVFEGGFACGWRPKMGQWCQADTFWDRVTCKRCLARRKP